MGRLWAYKSEGGRGGGGEGTRTGLKKAFQTSYLAVLIQILCEFTRFFKLLIVVKNRHVPDTFDVKQKNRNHETIATDFILNRQQRSLVNWAACKAVPVHKMGFPPSKNEHYQLWQGFQSKICELVSGKLT